MGPVTKLLGSGIGLASEAMAARKAKKEAGSTSPDPNAERSRSRSPAPPASYNKAAQESGVVGLSHARADESDNDPEDGPPSYGDIVDDEEDWELDEASHEQDGTLERTDSEGEKPHVRKILAKFLSSHPLPHNPANHPPLPCPVILPQRRPRTKSRGFVQAYAPVLKGVGIDQTAWMDFLATFHKASQASPIFTGILLASHLVGYVPSVALMVASTIGQVGAGAAIVMQSRSRTNTFLDDINEHFFRPRGLYVLLISYHGERHKWSSEPLDISHAVTKSVDPADADPSGNRGKKAKHNLQWSSGSTHGGMEMPESAPLIYPALDAAATARAAADPTGKKSSKWASSQNFVAEYMDRRAQATFNAESPDSSLAVPQTKEFASRYSDPNHPASSGSIISLLTGGHVDPRGMRRQRDDKKAQRRGYRGPVAMVRHYQPVRRAMRQVSSRES